ncbi:hypothetical protein [Streptomyces diastatochromogenes]|uniref:hypothetical protein n=1 Tax=Streptomyces diastatochromogenes TaxID=42236 RepID=UPI00367C64EC
MSMALYWLHHRPDAAALLSAELRTLPEHASTLEIASPVCPSHGVNLTTPHSIQVYCPSS